MKSDIDYIKHIYDEILFLREEFNKTNKDNFLSNNILKRAFVRSVENW
ncbi:toxin-antitoxin system, antitoxin component domain protein [Leptospira sp. serovar Kenya str. Sh9]|nr:toxin-antitoxin system, antitoxin component domain protein [Leptospira sp. serovar Kenya str. Sh9]